MRAFRWVRARWAEVEWVIAQEPERKVRRGACQFGVGVGVRLGFGGARRVMRASRERDMAMFVVERLDVEMGRFGVEVEVEGVFGGGGGNLC